MKLKMRQEKINSAQIYTKKKNWPTRYHLEILYLAMFGVILAYLILNWSYIFRHIQRRFREETKAETLRRELIEQGTQLHEKICTATGVCFNIQDAPFEKHGELVIERNMMVADTIYSFSAASLVFPCEITEISTNTSKWKINKRVLTSPYTSVMVGFAFAMEFEGLKYRSSKWQDVLMLGLGGGVMANFLSTIKEAKLRITSVEIDPGIRDIAVKWFSLEEDDKHNVVIDDGANFLRSKAKNGTRYKVIFLDACFKMCPAEVFLESRVVADMAHALDDSGVLAVNILTDPNKNERAQVSNRVLRLYRAYFSSCFLFYLKSQQILLCSHRTGWTFDEQEELFQRKLEEADKRLNFHFFK